MSKEKMPFVPDKSQQQVIVADGGYHLVLAPPGCGKTQILTERIRQAHAGQGIPYGEMLCLTFTNRAARGMQERISQSIDDPDLEEVYVGNVHRFCSKFLFENNVIAAETSVIDDEDAVSIVARFLDEDELQVMENATLRRQYFEMIHLSHLMRQIRHFHPKELRLHPEALNADDIAAMQKICDVQHMAFDASAVTDIYEHVDFYLEVSRSDSFDLGQQVIADRLFRKMATARHYEEYKQENHLVDFEDLLTMTYDELVSGENTDGYHRYRWIQVDEVQDLNPLQLAVIDLVTDASRPDFTVMYLGDEQQAIFSFMGAKLSTLDHLRERCRGHLHYLSTNHRSPAYLLEVFNEYARVVLHLNPDFLPVPSQASSRSGEKGPGEPPLRILRSNIVETEYYDVAHVAQNLFNAYPDDTTAIVVNSNGDADLISAELQKLGLRHFKVSGEDLFSSAEVKVLFAHLNVLANEHNFIAWARLLKGLHVTESNAYARNLMRSLLDRAMLPSDLLTDTGKTYVQRFAEVYEQEDIVVFDTETTGLDVFDDDIVQIAAVRMRQGRVVEGSEFNVFLQTSREIPAMLGDLPNPILEELRHHRQLPPAEALRQFMQYVGTSVLLGHNADYDIQILDHNLRRHAPSLAAVSNVGKNYLDSLKLVRMLEPDLKEYKLKYLLSVLHLEGENSHLADADVLATCSVVQHCYQKAKAVIPLQCQFMAQRRVQERAAALRRTYREVYLQSRERLFANDSSLVGEIQDVYRHFREEGLMGEIRNMEYITGYIVSDLIDSVHEHSLSQQLSAHIIELNTLKEADLCNSSSLTDRVFVSTIHKAKGLEFDNVIVFDAVEDRFPSYFNKNNPTGIAEDARKFYVAMTRARRRLYVSQSLTRIDYHNQVRPRKLTCFMNPILKYFD